MANLLIDLTLTSSHTVGGSFADIAGMSDTVTIAGTGSVVILIMSLNPEMINGSDECAEYRFTHDGARVGPEVSSFVDAADEGSGRTLMFALTGLSAGSHTFAVQAQNRSGTAVIDTAYPRTFQAVEIETGASLLVDLETQAADTAPVAFANMVNLSQAQTPAAGALLLFLHGSQMLGSSGDAMSEHRFAIDGVRDGPLMGHAADSTNETTGLVMAWAVTGVSAASHTFSIQWQDVAGTPDMDTGRLRVFQVVEITDDFGLLVDNESVSAQSAPASYADMTDMSGTPSIDSINSVALVLANYSILPDSDDTADNFLSIGGAQEGAEVSLFTDIGSPERGDSLLMARAVTGEVGATAMSLQWQIRKSTPNTDTGRERTFQVIDFKDVAVVIPPVVALDKLADPTIKGKQRQKIGRVKHPAWREMEIRLEREYRVNTELFQSIKLDQPGDYLQILEAQQEQAQQDIDTIEARIENLEADRLADGAILANITTDIQIAEDFLERALLRKTRQSELIAAIEVAIIYYYY